jgi:CRP-like cAMP-binding protein
MADKDPFSQLLKHFPKGHVLFHEGDEGEEMYILRAGKVAIKKRVPHGEVTLAVLEKGDFFGEMAILERMPRSASAEMVEDSDLVVIGSDVFGDMIKNTPEIAVRMLRKYSIRLRETTRQIEQMSFAGGTATGVPRPRSRPPGLPGGRPGGGDRLSSPKPTGQRLPVFKSDSLLGRYDSVTGMSPEVDLSNEDQSRNISRRHARLVLKDGKPYIAEEIGTMNGTFLNGQKLATGVLTPIKDGDELTLCRLSLTFRLFSQVAGLAESRASISWRMASGSEA